MRFCTLALQRSTAARISPEGVFAMASELRFSNSRAAAESTETACMASAARAAPAFDSSGQLLSTRQTDESAAPLGAVLGSGVSGEGVAERSLKERKHAIAF